MAAVVVDARRRGLDVLERDPAGRQRTRRVDDDVGGVLVDALLRPPVEGQALQQRSNTDGPCWPRSAYCYARAALPRDLLPLADADHIDRQVGEIRREGGREVSPPLSMKTMSRSGWRCYIGDRCQVDRSVLADRGVRTAAGLHAEDPIFWQGLQPAEDQGVFLGVDAVGDDGDGDSGRASLCRAFGQGGLARADRAADADTKRSVRRDQRLNRFRAEWRSSCR